MLRPLALVLLFAASAQAQTADQFAQRGLDAYQAGAFAEGARLLTAALDAGARDGDLAYNAACAAALAGDADAAFRLLRLAPDLGFQNADLLQRDADLAGLHDDPRWPGAVARVARRAEADRRLWNGPAFRTPFADTLSVDERVAGLSRLWAEVKFNFANFDLVPDGLDWDSLYVATLPRVRGEVSTLDYYRVLQSVVARLHDGHTNVWLPPALADRATAQPGLGTRLVEGRVLIDKVRDPALARLGVEAGQEVVEVDGVPVHEYAAREVRPFVSSPTAIERDVWTYEYELLSGDAAAPVALTLRDAEGRQRRVAVPRLDNAAATALSGDPESPTPPPPFALDWLPGGIAHVRLAASGGPEAADQFLERFPEIAEAAGVVLDVRENGGGSGAVGYRVLCALTDAERLSTSAWRTRLYRPAYRAWGRGESTEGDAAPSFGCDDALDYAGPVVLLVGPRTGSAAEDLAVAFDLLGRGPLVGEPTAGSSGQPLSFSLPGGGSARVTAKRDLYPDGREFVGVGVQPAVVARPTVAGVRAGRDEALEAAVAAIRSTLP